jgi:hypothetical protein
LKGTVEVTALFRGAYLLASGGSLAGVRVRRNGRKEIIRTPMLLCVSPKYNPVVGQGGFIFSLTAVSIFGAAGGNRSSVKAAAAPRPCQSSSLPAKRSPPAGPGVSLAPDDMIRLIG